MNNRQLLQDGAAQLGVKLEQNQVDNLIVFFEELKKWSRRINLIARDTGDKEIIENHFLDSLSVLSILKKEKGTLLDVGTGAGFPGLVLAVVEPERTFILVEPRKKRVSFLNHIVRRLQLGNVVVLAERIEDCFDHEQCQQVALITSRAVASPALFLPMIQRFLEKGAKVILMVAKKQRLKELDQLEHSYRITGVQSFKLPYCQAARVLALAQISPEHRV